MDAPTKRGPVAATAAGAGVGTLGGLLGLGGAEFRLPLLVVVFNYPLRRAVPINLAVSFVAVIVAAVVRWSFAKQAPIPGTALVIACMMAGGMLGAALGARWLGSISDARLHTAVRFLLIVIGALLIIEAAIPWTSNGVPVGSVGQGVAALGAGVLIGAVSTLLGHQGGRDDELGHQHPDDARRPHAAPCAGRIPGRGRRVIVPMGLGTVVGSAVGGFLIAYAPAGAIKVLLGLVLIVSALRVLRVRA